jgi:tetratricopeptide (TPR) repeat protein
LLLENPDDPRALYVLARTNENLGRPEEADEAYRKLASTWPSDPVACQAIGDFHRRQAPLDPARMQNALSTFEHCATLAPNDPTAFYTVAALYWEGTRYDHLLDNAGRDAFAERGIAAADRALALRPDYSDAMLFKALLLRVKAEMAPSTDLRQQYEQQANELMAAARTQGISPQ